MQRTELERLFDQEMRALWEGINTAGLIEIARPQYQYYRGGVQAARVLTLGPSLSAFQELAERGRLDLTVESLVVRPVFAPLFAEQEIEMARTRLADAGYEFPDDDDDKAVNTQGMLTIETPRGSELLQGLTRELVIEAMRRFDSDLRGKRGWLTWEQNHSYLYAIEYEGRLYPVKEIIRLALNVTNIHGGEPVNRPLRELGFTIVELPGRGEDSAPSGGPSLEEQTQPMVSTMSRTWIFQGSPWKFDVSGAVATVDELRWVVRQHRADIHTNDTVYLWESGPKAGIVAVAQVTSEPTILPPDEATRTFAREPMLFDDEELRAILKIEMVLPQRLTRDELRTVPALENMAILRTAQGTNFPVTDQEATALRDLVETKLLAETHDDGPIFVIIQGADREAQRYGLRYELPDYESGEYGKIRAALETWQQGGPPVRLLIYRPGPIFAFTAWATVTHIQQRQGSTRHQSAWILHLDQHEFEPPLSLKHNAAALMDEIPWLKPGLTVAFRNHTVRQIPLEEFNLIIERASSLRDDRWALAQPTEPTPMPTLHADADTQFWRIHSFPPAYWPDAQREGVIGISERLAPAHQSVKRFKQIKVGDRVVLYRSGGFISGVGIVTSPAVDIRVESADGMPPDLFGGQYPRRLRVRWSPDLSDPVNLHPSLQTADYKPLFERLTNPHTVVPLRREDYEALLALLGIDDLSPEPTGGILPSAWPTLAPFRDFVQSLAPGPHSTAAVWEQAAAFGQGFNEVLDEQSFLEELRQLRLLAPVPEQPDAYQPQPHTIGDPTALLRLMALALLVPSAGTETEYELPARTLVPRILATGGPQPAESFAPVLGEEGPKLLAWYAEAGLVTQDEAGWQPAPAGWEPLPGDDAATREANELVAALRHERMEALPPIVDGPLPAVSDFAARLNELTQDFIIDEGLVRRIVRSLLAGRHVVLSGPPGTGKTELAKRLPLLFWRGESHTLTHLTSDPDKEPVLTEQAQRHGYLPLLVTATEDWGVRDVVGGIAPRLDGSERSLGYDIQHGHLTRAILRHYEGTEQGKRLPPAMPSPAKRYRRTEVRENGQRYQGIWLVIDEFTRAPVDAAFGSLLTTLGGGDSPKLAVPSGDFGEAEVPLPKDFRIIGTLNSFDRHFLNQMSEALKRRFDFIDVPPPPPSRRADEQGSAAKKALKRLSDNQLGPIETEGGGYRWGELWVQPDRTAGGFYRLGADSPDIRVVLRSFWNLFEAIRVFRQLGTAQAVAVYSTLFAGVLVGMGWEEALDSALADSLADQLQVMERDEQRILALYVERAGDAAEFTDRVKKLAEQMPPGRRPALLRTLREADEWRNPAVPNDISEEDPKALTATQLSRVFALGEPLALPPASHFLRRLRALIGERGL